jgi:hypothetical protein
VCCKKKCNNPRLYPWYLCESCIKEIADKIAKPIEIVSVMPDTLPIPSIRGGGGGGRSVDDQLASIKKKSTELKRDWFSSKAR